MSERDMDRIMERNATRIRRDSLDRLMEREAQVEIQEARLAHIRGLGLPDSVAREVTQVDSPRLSR